MVLTGEGCLTKDDIAIFETGWLIQLPADGRVVICSDRSKKTTSVAEYHASCRMVFFATQSSIGRKVVWLVNFSNPEGAPARGAMSLVAGLVSLGW